MTQGNGASRGLLLASYIAIYFVWGSTYLAIRLCVETMPPFFCGAVRFTVAGAILFVAASLRGVERATVRGWLEAAKAGFFAFTLAFGLLTWAEVYVPSSIAALIIALEPAWFVLFDWLLFRGPRPTVAIVVGQIVGIAGCAVLVIGDPNASFSVNPEYVLGIGAIFLCGFAWVYGSLLSRNTGIHNDTMMTSGMQMLAGGGMLLVASLLSGDFGKLHGVSTTSIVSLAYLVIFGSIVSYSAYVYLLRHQPAARVATHGFINPIVAVFLGWAIADEPITASVIAAAGMVALSVGVTLYSQWRQSRDR